jgi:hypothetical protein
MADKADKGEPLGLRERKKERTREELQRVALELCLEFGYDNVSTKQIAVAAGVSESTLFRSVGTKVGLVEYSPFVPLLLAELRHTPAESTIADCLRTAIPIAVSKLSQAQWDLEVQRRAVVMGSNDLIVSSIFEVSGAIQEFSVWLRERVGKKAADADVLNYGVFLFYGFANAPFAPGLPPSVWGDGLVAVADRVAGGIRF